MEDRAYQQHQERQLKEVTPDVIQARMRDCRASDHYRFNGREWIIGAYEGCGILTMLSDHADNTPLKTRLTEVQQALLSTTDEGLWYALPATSYHQTVANMLSNDCFRRHIVEMGVEHRLPEVVKNAFDTWSPTAHAGPACMRIAGIGVFCTALGVLGVFENHSDYERITAFRAGFYGAEQMTALGVRMTRPFVAHITLGYFGSGPEERQIQALTEVINELNVDFQRNEYRFFIGQAGLRRYDNLSGFRREASFPIVKI